MDGDRFTSSLFKVEPVEDGLVNPGSRGWQLADFLKTQLEQLGDRAEPAMAENWGQCDPFLLWDGCGNVDNAMSDDPVTGKMAWHCVPVAEVPMLKRHFGEPGTRAALSNLDAGLRSIPGAESAITLVSAPWIGQATKHSKRTQYVGFSNSSARQQ